MNRVFSARAGVAVSGGGTFCRADWPLGKVTLDAEGLTIDALFSSYRLPLTSIDQIRPGLLTTQVEHHATDVPPRVRIWGLVLFRRLRHAVEHHDQMVKVRK